MYTIHVALLHSAIGIMEHWNFGMMGFQELCRFQTPIFPVPAAPSFPDGFERM
jgi:hypothetical protein